MGGKNARVERKSCHRGLPKDRPPRHIMRVVRCMSELGHVWTAPAVQEESDYQRSVRVQSCIRPLSAAVLTAGPDVIR